MTALSRAACAVALLGAALLGPAGRGHAQASRTNEARVALEEGRRRYADLDFDAAVDALRRALATPGLLEAERLEALEYLGCAYVVLERNDSARGAFEEMLRLDPYRVLREPTGSPRIRSFVTRLRARLVPDAAIDERVRVRVRLPRRVRVSQAVRVRVDVLGPRAVASAAVVWRLGDGDYRTAALRGTGRRFDGRLPPASSTDDLELYVVARDAEGRVVARGGEPALPLQVSVVAGSATGPSAEPTPSVLSRWWFWAAAAGVVASSVLVAVLVSGGEPAPNGTLSPGRVEIP